MENDISVEINVQCLECGAATPVMMRYEGYDFIACGKCGHPILFSAVMVPVVQVYPIGAGVLVPFDAQRTNEQDYTEVSVVPGEDATEEPLENKEEEQVENEKPYTEPTDDTDPTVLPTIQKSYGAHDWSILEGEKNVSYRRITGVVPGYDVKYSNSGPRFLSDANVLFLMREMKNSGRLTDTINKVVGSKVHSSQASAINQFIRGAVAGRIPGIEAMVDDS